MFSLPVAQANQAYLNYLRIGENPLEFIKKKKKNNKLVLSLGIRAKFEKWDH